MSQIIAPAHITADEPKRNATSALRSLSARVIKSLITTVVRTKEHDIAERYEGSGWCDQTEHDLNYDVITGRYARRP